MNADAMIRLLASSANYEAGGRAPLAFSTATPTTATHTAHLVVDRTNNELWFWNGSAYENVTLQAFSQQTALTTAETTITNAGTASDYAIQALTNSGAFGFVTAAEGESVVEVVLNNQLRINELEDTLQALGLLA